MKSSGIWSAFETGLFMVLLGIEHVARRNGRLGIYDFVAYIEGTFENIVISSKQRQDQRSRLEGRPAMCSRVLSAYLLLTCSKCGKKTARISFFKLLIVFDKFGCGGRI